jgi:hypothetical protein
MHNLNYLLKTMKKQIIFLFNVAVLAGSFSLYSCKKKTEATPALAPASIQASINGNIYKASTQVVVPNVSVFTDSNSNYNPSIATNGSYINASYTNSAAAPYNYQYLIFQTNIVAPGDTLTYAISISSKSAITQGTYTLYGGANKPTPAINTLGVASYLRNNFSDSSVTGTITITELDAAKKLASGTFSFTDIGTKGSSPSTASITNGTFTNLILQEL